MIAFTNTERRLINLNTNNTYIDADIANAVNTIGEKKRIRFTYTTDISIEGYVFYINLALFMPKGAINPIRGKGEVYWQVQIPDTVTNGATLQAYLTANSSATMIYPLRNWDVKIETTNNQEFVVVAEFYQTCDVLSYMTNQVGQFNVERLLKDRYTNLQRLTQSGSSIYGGSVQHDGRVYIYAEYNIDPSDYGSIETSFGDYRANFYGAYPSAYNPGSVEFSYWVGATEVDTIQADTNTQVDVRIYSPDHVPTLAMVMIRINDNDPTIDFVENYGLESVVVDAAAENQARMIQPMTSPVNSTPNYYTATFTINAENVEPGDQFAFIALVYDPTGEIVSSYYERAPDVATERPFNGNGFTITGVLGDVQQDYTGNELTAVVEERMKSELTVSYPANQFRNDILDRLGIDIGVNDIAYYLTRIRFKIYEEYVVAASPDAANATYRNYFIEREMVKERGNPNIWGNQTSEFSAVSAPNELQLLAFWRNGYESNVDCLRSTIDGVDYGQKLVSQNWSDKDLKVEWTLVLDYSRSNINFSDEIVFTQKLHPNGYTNDIVITLQDVTQEDDATFCSNSNINLQAEFSEPLYENHRLIVNIEPSPGSTTTIEEAEAFAPGNITQLTSTKITSEEVSVGQTAVDKAKFSLVGAELQDLEYKVSAIIKKQ